MDPKKDRFKIIGIAEKYVQEGKFEDAIAEYEKLLERDELDVDISTTIGDLYTKLSKDDKAIDIFHDIAAQCEKKGLYSQARAAYKKIVKLDPRDIRSAIKLADLLAVEGFIPEAKVEYLKIAERLKEAKRIKDLVPLYEKITKLDKKDFDSRLTLAGLYREEGLVDEAVKELNEIAEYMIENNELQTAEQVLGRAKEINEDHERTVSNLIKLFKKEKKTKEAIGLVENKLRKDKDNLDFLGLLGNLYFEDRDFQRAEEIFSKISSEQPLNLDVKIKLGRIKIEKDDLDHAFKMYEPLVDSLLKNEKEERAIGLLGLILSSERIHLPTLEKLASIYKSRNQKKNLEVADRLLLEEYRDRNLREEMLSVLKELMDLFPHDRELENEYKILTGKERPRLPFEKVKVAEKIRLERVPPVSAETKVVEKKKEVKAPPPVAEKKVVEKIEVEKFPSLSIEPKVVEKKKEVKAPPPVAEKKVVEKIEVEKFPSLSVEPKVVEKKEVKAPPPVAEKKIAERIVVEKIPPVSIEPRVIKRKEEKVLLPLEEKKIIKKIEAEKVPPLRAEEKAFEEAIEDEFASIPERDREMVKMNFAKADLYLEQGLFRNAKRILENLRLRYSDEPVIVQKIAQINKMQAKTHIREEEIPALIEKVAAKEAEIEGRKLREVRKKPLHHLYKDFVDGERVAISGTLEEGEIVLPLATEAGDMKYYDLTKKIDEELATIETIFDEQLQGKVGIGEKELSSIVSEFKKGVEEKIDKSDYESHYNLGIAFFEQELIEEAIEEFKLAAKDPRQTVDCYSIISYCYRRKRDFKEAVGWIEKGLELCKEGSIQFFSLKYEMASLYEELKELDKALSLYKEIKEWNADYKDVSEKVQILEKI